MCCDSLQLLVSPVLGGSRLPCDLTSFMDLRRVFDFFSLFSFLLVKMECQFPSPVPVGPERATDYSFK